VQQAADPSRSFSVKHQPNLFKVCHVQTAHSVRAIDRVYKLFEADDEWGAFEQTTDFGAPVNPAPAKKSAPKSTNAAVFEAGHKDVLASFLLTMCVTE